jgi:hypothetical protein
MGRIELGAQAPGKRIGPIVILSPGDQQCLIDLLDGKMPTEDVLVKVDPHRWAVLSILAGLPDEAFNWFVMWAGGFLIQWPDGLGGFSDDSEIGITALRRAAKEYIDAHADAHAVKPAATPDERPIKVRRPAG